MHLAKLFILVCGLSFMKPPKNNNLRDQNGQPKSGFTLCVDLEEDENHVATLVITQRSGFLSPFPAFCDKIVATKTKKDKIAGSITNGSEAKR